jgi:hypothetical protein
LAGVAEVGGDGGPIGGDPGGVAFAELGHHGGGCLVGVGQQGVGLPPQVVG